jgi:hypothetical protein
VSLIDGCYIRINECNASRIAKIEELVIRGNIMVNGSCFSVICLCAVFVFGCEKTNAFNFDMENFGGDSGNSEETGGSDTGGFDTGGVGSDTGGVDTGGVGSDTGGVDTGGVDTGGVGSDMGGFDTGGFDTGGFDTGGFDTGGNISNAGSSAVTDCLARDGLTKECAVNSCLDVYYPQDVTKPWGGVFWVVPPELGYAIKVTCLSGWTLIYAHDGEGSDYGCLEEKDLVANNDRAYLKADLMVALAKQFSSIKIVVENIKYNSSWYSRSNTIPIINIRNQNPITAYLGWKEENWSTIIYFNVYESACSNNGSCLPPLTNKRYPTISEGGALPYIDECYVRCPNACPADECTGSKLKAKVFIGNWP